MVVINHTDFDSSVHYGPAKWKNPDWKLNCYFRPAKQISQCHEPASCTTLYLYSTEMYFSVLYVHGSRVSSDL